MPARPGVNQIDPQADHPAIGKAPTNLDVARIRRILETADTLNDLSGCKQGAGRDHKPAFPDLSLKKNAGRLSVKNYCGRAIRRAKNGSG